MPMPWIVFGLWLLLTPIWISYSSAELGSKAAFIPPALVLLALALQWLWKRLVIRVAGEFEPSRFHPSWGFALPSRDTVRIGLAAAAVGVCIGAVVGESTFHVAISGGSANRSTNSPISVRTETIKPQLFSAEPETVETGSNPTISMRTEAVKAPAEPMSSANAGAKRAEAQMPISGQSSPDQPPCDIQLCERYNRSFRASDYTYQPYGGPRQYCTR